jgi:hypothetical protein
VRPRARTRAPRSAGPPVPLGSRTRVLGDTGLIARRVPPWPSEVSERSGIRARCSSGPGAGLARGAERRAGVPRRSAVNARRAISSSRATPLERQPPAPQRDQRVDLLGAPQEPGASGRTGEGCSSSGSEISHSRSTPLGGREQCAGARQGVVDEALVGLEHVLRPACLAERELHAGLLEVHPGPRSLAVKRQREPRRVGQVERQLVGTGDANAGVRGEDRLGRIAKGDAYDPGSLSQALARAQEERHTSPAPVVDAHARGDERLHCRVGRHAGSLR